jgi:hypothetical protein
MKKIICVFSGMFAFLFSIGQTYESIHITIFGSGAIPLGEFKNAVSADNSAFGVGGGASALFNPKGKNEYCPVFIGVDFNYLTFGRDKQPATAGIPPLKTSFNNYGISALSRFFLSNRPSGIVPFIDGQLGLNIANATTKVDKNLLNTVLGDDFPEVINNANDLGLLYGFGLGLYTRKPMDGSGDSRSSFFFKASYLGGDAINHVKRGSIRIVNGNVFYETTTTRFQNILVQLGMNISF